MSLPSFDVVIPTIGRPSLATLLEALGRGTGPRPGLVIVVDDRRSRRQCLVPRGVDLDGLPVSLRRGFGAGPAAARNLGWRAASAEWIAFLDDDVVPSPDWFERLAADLAGLDAGVAASQGQVEVPLSSGRRPTDWERNVRGLERARWATADMAYRRSVLATLGGFDERFTHAFREDADLALRVVAAGHRIVQGKRRVSHPVRPADRWISVRLQRGNADDALMRALHGPGWERRAGAAVGRRPLHLAIAAAAALALAGFGLRRRRMSLLVGAGWLGGTAELALSRIAPGPRTGGEVATMVLTSAVIPFAASYHWLRGLWRWRRARPRPAAVLFDRDGTLVVDVPYNGDPSRVVLMPGARPALERLRAAGIRTAVISNQSGVARGRLTMEQVEAVNRRIEELLGPVGPWLVCPHAPDERCGCRKPAPGLVLEAARRLGVPPSQCVVVGDVGSDVEAARLAGARAILVPTSKTMSREVAGTAEVAHDLASVVDRVVGGRS